MSNWYICHIHPHTIRNGKWQHCVLSVCLWMKCMKCMIFSNTHTSSLFQNENYFHVFVFVRSSFRALVLFSLSCCRVVHFTQSPFLSHSTEKKGREEESHNKKILCMNGCFLFFLFIWCWCCSSIELWRKRNSNR